MKYFVSFAYKTENYSGFSNREIDREKKITGQDDIYDIQVSLSREIFGALHAITILNFILLEETK